ncbi:MAG: hypothetical protein Q4B06_00950 [Candidatus Saccharibacteria bacterium]|nr:hypothetical protein [Candidatus Saccharibacteria bacterium]
MAVTRVAEHEEACFVIVPYKVLHRPTPNTVLARVYRAEPTLASVLALSSFKDFSALHTQHATTIQLKRYIKFDKPIESAFGAGQLSRTARNTKKALATGYVCTAGRFSVPQDYLDSLLSDHTS